MSSHYKPVDVGLPNPNTEITTKGHHMQRPNFKCARDAIDLIVKLTYRDDDTFETLVCLTYFSTYNYLYNFLSISPHHGLAELRCVDKVRDKSDLK